MQKNKNQLQVIRKFRLADNLKVTLPFPAEVPFKCYYKQKDGTMLAFALPNIYICIKKTKNTIMGQTAVTIRMDSDLKQKFDVLCNDFGMSVNTAFNVFVRTVVRTKSIPFKIESSAIAKEDLLAKGRNAFEQLRLQAENNGLSSMTLDEINAEIRESRN